MPDLNCVFVCNTKTGEKFLASNNVRDNKMPWNNGGTATEWIVRKPFSQTKVVWGEENGNLMVIPVYLSTDMPKFTYGDKLTINKGNKYCEVDDYIGDAKPIERDATVIVDGFMIDYIENTWIYVVSEANPLLNPVQWQIREADVKAF